MTPNTASWKLGSDKHGRHVVLHFKDGAWNLESEPVNQRDEGEKIYSLTADVLIKAADIVKAWRP